MRFRLVYRGQLKGGNSKDVSHIQEVRRSFHSQLKVLWQQPPLSGNSRWLQREQPQGETCVLESVGAFTFAPLVTTKLRLHAELDILFLRPAPPGEVVRHGGELDNRIKTLIDCLRIPVGNEIPRGDAPREDENPFFCLLQDDKLVSAFSVTSDRLLKPDAHEQDVEIVITVRTRATEGTWGNLSLSV